MKVFTEGVFCVLLLASPVLSQGPASLPSYGNALNINTAGAPGLPQIPMFRSESAFPQAPFQYLPARFPHSEHHQPFPAPLESARSPHSERHYVPQALVPQALVSQSMLTMPSLPPVALAPAGVPAVVTPLPVALPPVVPTTVPSGPSDTDLLAFFLNLLCLHAQFYSCSATGSPLNSTMSGNGPAPASCRQANMNTTLAEVVNEFAREETAHLALISDTLMTANITPVCPMVNIDSVFNAMAMTAFAQAGLPLNFTFNAYLDDLSFLFVASLLEDLAASALLGGQALMTNPDLRLVAGQMGNAKSYHAGILRAMLATSPLLQQNDVLFSTTVINYLNTLAGSPQLIFGLTNAQGVSLANVNAVGLIPVATPAQVLKLVTLGASTGNGGGFFPNNLNGNIRN